eukprot:scaffold275491_cov28-Tisochrysis_lutea.AAC.4
MHGLGAAGDGGSEEVCTPRRAVAAIGGDGKSLLLEALLECGRSIFKLVIGKRQARVKQWLMPRAPGRRRRHIHTCDSRQGRACILDE